MAPINKRGYITIESCIVLPFVICLIMSIASLTKIAYTQSVIEGVLYESAQELARDTYLFDKLEVYESGNKLNDKIKIKLEFIKKINVDLFNISTEYVDNLINEGFNIIGIELYKVYFNNNLAGKTGQGADEILKQYRIENLSFSNTKISRDEIYINVEYSIKNNIPIDFIGKINISDGVYIKGLSRGESIANSINSKEVIELDYDIWEIDKLVRGKKIAELLGNNLGYVYYGIDKIENRQITSIVSIDTRKATYNFDSGLYKQVKSKIDELDQFIEGDKHNKIITRTDYDTKAINIVIPKEELTQEQEKELSQAKRYAKEKNIKFKVTIVCKKEAE